MAAHNTHVLLLSYPILGHINPCMHFARILASHGFLITFVVSQHTYDRCSMAHHSQNPHSSRIRLVGIPDNLPPHHPRQGSTLKLSLDVLHGIRPGVEDLLHKLQQEHSPVSCIIADTFVIWAYDVATKFRIPWFALYTGNAHAFSLVFHSQSLVSKGLLPFKGNGYDYDPSFVIDCIPGVFPLHPLDFPFSLRFYLQFALDQVKHIDKAEGAVLSTFYEIESTTLDALQKEIPIYPIGFMQLLCTEMCLDSSGSIIYWPEDDKCLVWLNSQPLSSVLYVSFGSVAIMEAEQIRKLADGLESSEQPFLWVIRPDALKGPLSEVLPECFAERTKSRGLIVTWAPQLRVLSHPSIGGFLTHCGWNSVTENLCTGGVPMICWPHAAEQRLNCKLLVDVWKIGEELKKETDGMVNREEVERAVRALMQKDGGREKRMRAAEMKGKARRAVGEDGSSMKHMKALVEEIRKKAQASIVEVSL